MSQQDTVEDTVIEVPHDVQESCDSADCSALLRKRVYASVALGVVPVPVVDFVGLTAIQIELVRALCKAHGVPFKKRTATAVVSAIAGAAAPVLVAPLAFSLLKFVPVVGQGIAGVTLPVLFGASTYAVGKIVNAHLQDGKTLESIDLAKAKEVAGHYVEEGKKMARQAASKLKKDKGGK